MNTIWTALEAPENFGEIVENAQTIGPQIITRNGEPAIVVVSAAEWARKTERVGSLATFFAASPLPGSGLEIERMNDAPLPLDF